MNTLDLLSDLRSRGIVVTLDANGEQLKINAPKGAVTDALRRELSENKEAILEFLLDAQASGDLPPITPSDPTAGPVMSYAQERVWQLHRLAPDASTMNVAVAWELRGDVDHEVLRASVDALVMRHGQLRAQFREVDGAAHVEIATEPTSRLDVHRLKAGGDLDAAVLAAEAITSEPFDLSVSTLRPALIEIAPDHAVLLLVFHQIVFDWGAARAVVDDLSAIHTALTSGHDADLQRLELSYVDYARWQRNWIESGESARHEEYWAEQLAVPYQPLRLPGRVDSHEGDGSASVDIRLAADVSEQLRDLGRQSGATLYMTMLGGWQALLGAYGDADEAIVFTMLGASRAELKSLVGLFANPMPIRTDLAGDPTAQELVRRVADVALGAFRHQDLPLERIVDHVRVDGAGGLFQSLFVFQHEPVPPLQIEGVETELVTVGEHVPAFELRLFIDDDPGGISGWIEYDTTRTSAAAVEHLAHQYVTLLERMVQRPNESMSTLLPVSDADRAAAATHRHADPAGRVLPRNETEERLGAIWNEVFGTEVGVCDDFFDLGGHSLLAVSLFAAIEKEFGRSLPLATLYESATIEGLARILDEDDWQLRWASLVPIQPNGRQRPVFCVAGLGDEIIQFRDLATMLNRDRPFYGLQLGLDRSDQVLTTIPAMAEHYLREIRTVQPEGPYVLAGYCFGGFPAYEMAQQLQAAGEQVAGLIMIEADAPGGVTQHDASPLVRAQRVVRRLRRRGLRHSAGLAWRRSSRMVRFRVWGPIRGILHRRLDAAGGRVPGALRDVMDINARAAAAYSSAMPPYEGDIVVIRAEKMLPNREYADHLGWGEYARGTTVSYWIPGNHEGIWHRPNVEVYAKQLDSVLDEIDQRAKNAGKAT